MIPETIDDEVERPVILLSQAIGQELAAVDTALDELPGNFGRLMAIRQRAFDDPFEIALVICLIVITDTHLFVLSRAIGQSPKKTISHAKWKGQPVEFATVKAAGKTLSIKAEKAQTEYKQEFDGDDDWIKGLVIHLKNTSNKNIIYINFNLSFPETNAGAVIAQPLEFGSYPDKPPVASNEKVLKPGEEEKVLKPGEETDITLTDETYAGLIRSFQSRNFQKVNALEIILQFVIFEDDTAWLGGSLMKRDPFNPKAWARIVQQ